MTEDFTQVSGHAAVLRRRGWIIVLTALLGAIIGALAVPLASSTYSAESVVLIPVPEDADTAVVDTQVEVITSDRVVQDVVEELGNEADPGDLLDSLTVEVVPDTTAISITSSQENPEAAAQVANAFASSYVGVFEEAQFQKRRGDAAALQQRLDAATDRLVRLREQLPTLTGLEQIEVETAIDRQQQRQTRLVQLLAEVRDPTTAMQTASVLQQAVAPTEDTGGWVRGALFGLVLGLLVGAAIAYGRHYTDDRIHDGNELAALVGSVPLLGRIPRATKGRRGGGVLSDPSSKTAEAYRGLAVNLRLKSEHPRAATGATTGGDHAAVGAGIMALIVSASPGEGKSSVAEDLARTAAGMGLRVMLVDADLRNPQLATRFEAPSQPGLTDALQPGSAAAPHPVEVGVDNLRLLPAGDMHADPATLLSKVNPTEVWDTLRVDNDLVVVDTAPVLYAAETLELATVADRVVLVVERGRTTRRDVRTVLERMDLVGARPTGVVLTKVPAKDVVGGYYPRQS